MKPLGSVVVFSRQIRGRFLQLYDHGVEYFKNLQEYAYNEQHVVEPERPVLGAEVPQMRD